MELCPPLSIEELIFAACRGGWPGRHPLRLPDQLLVITGGEIAYTRKDGVKVIPIGCLKN